MIFYILLGSDKLIYFTFQHIYYVYYRFYIIIHKILKYYPLIKEYIFHHTITSKINSPQHTIPYWNIYPFIISSFISHPHPSFSNQLIIYSLYFLHLIIISHLHFFHPSLPYHSKRVKCYHLIIYLTIYLTMLSIQESNNMNQTILVKLISKKMENHILYMLMLQDSIRKTLISVLIQRML